MAEAAYLGTSEQHQNVQRLYLEMVGIAIRRWLRHFTVCIAILFNGFCAVSQAAEMRILQPVPHQVIQRVGYEPLRADQHERGGPELGYGSVHIEVGLPNTTNGTFQYRIKLLNDLFGKAVDWTRLEGSRSSDLYDGIAKLPAGGWYRLEVRLVEGGDVLAEAFVEPIGVGEVFIIAGQSYAGGYSDALTQIEDPQGRVAAYDVVKKTWSLANDPQPNVGPGGTIWPSMCNALLPVIQVPIGLINVAVDATSSRKWLPGGKLYYNFAAAGKKVGFFRFVLWQQGESDVAEKVGTDAYIDNIIRIRAGLVNEWGFEAPWLLAKSTLHPTVYNDPIHEGYIRAAIDQLWITPGFRPGPDTDVLGGENRGGPHSMRHFSELGQRRAGMMWFAVIWYELQRSDKPCRKRSAFETQEGGRDCNKSQDITIHGRENYDPPSTKLLP